MIKVIVDELGIFRLMKKSGEKSDAQSVDFMEKYEIGGRRIEKEDIEGETEEETIDNKIEFEMKRKEIGFFRSKSGFGRQVITKFFSKHYFLPLKTFSKFF